MHIVIEFNRLPKNRYMNHHWTDKRIKGETGRRGEEKRGKMLRNNILAWSLQYIERTIIN